MVSNINRLFRRGFAIAGLSVAAAGIPTGGAVAQTFTYYSECTRFFCPNWDSDSDAARRQCMQLCNDYFDIGGGDNGGSEGGGGGGAGETTIVPGGRPCYGSSIIDPGMYCNPQ